MINYNIETVTENLKTEEGFRGSVYQDHLGFWTIGYGRMVDENRNGRISEDEAEFLLHNDIIRTVKELDRALPWLAQMPQNVCDVIVELCFQMGLPTLLKFKITLQLIEDEKFNAAAEELLNSRFAEQTPARAKRLSERLQAAAYD